MDALQGSPLFGNMDDLIENRIDLICGQGNLVSPLDTIQIIFDVILHLCLYIPIVIPVADFTALDDLLNANGGLDT